VLVLLDNLWKFIADPKNTAYLVFIAPFFVFYAVKLLGYLKRVAKTGKWRIKKLKIAGQEVEFAETQAAEAKRDTSMMEAACMECESRIVQALPILLAELRMKDHAILRAEYSLESYITLKKQMQIAENAGSKVQTLLTKRFFSLMEESRRSGGSLGEVEDLNQHGDYIFYTLAIKAITEDTFAKLRSWFRENGMEDVPEGDFNRLYCEPRVELMIQSASDMLNALWHGKFIDRAGLYEANRELFPEIRSIFYDIFLQARQAAKDAKAEMARLEEEYRLWVDKLLCDFINRYTGLCDEDRQRLLDTAKEVARGSLKG
jgi:hypothetical protein